MVLAGGGVTGAQLAVLESLGLLEGNRFDIMMMTGVGLLSLLAMVALFFFIMQFDRKMMSDIRKVLLLAVIFLVTMMLCVLIAQINPYLAPVSMVLLLAASLLSPSLALICHMIALLLVTVLTNTAGTTFTPPTL